MRGRQYHVYLIADEESCWRTANNNSAMAISYILHEKVLNSISRYVHDMLYHNLICNTDCVPRIIKINIYAISLFKLVSQSIVRS